jgi:hypothetical protein
VVRDQSGAPGLALCPLLDDISEQSMRFSLNPRGKFDSFQPGLGSGRSSLRVAGSGRLLDRARFHELTLGISSIDRSAVDAESLGFRYQRLCSIRFILLSSELIEDHQLQRLHRLEILRLDLKLGNHKIELGFDLQHQRDHIHRVQSDIDQSRLRVDINSYRVLIENAPDERKNAILDAWTKVLHSNSPFSQDNDKQVSEATLSDCGLGE